MDRLQVCIAVFAVLLLAPTFVPAAIINVPDDAETIADAVAACETGDTVLIADGRYEGQGNTNIAIAIEITVMSINGPENCIIDCGEENNSRGISISQPVRIRGITITGATNCALLIADVEGFAIEDCIITDNPGGQGQQSSGLDVRMSTGVLTRTIISNNRTPTSGGGMYINGTTLTVRDCIIEGNSAGRFGGGALMTGHSVVEMVNSLILENECGIDGGGLAFSVESRGPVDNCNFIGNRAGNEVDNGGGGGLYVGSESRPVVLNSIFWENEADIANQIFVQEDRNGALEISHCVVQGGVDEDGNWDGEAIIDEEPAFTEGREPLWGPDGFFLDEESPCLDAGSLNAADSPVAGYTTRGDLLDDEDVVDIGFHYHFSWFEYFARLFGAVTSANDDRPIEGAVLTTSRNQSAVTDEDGRWEILNAYALPTILVINAEWFNPLVSDEIEPELDGELEVNFQMTRPLIEFDPPEIVAQLNADDSTSGGLTIVNSGDGYLDWSASFGLREEFIHEPWSLRDTLPFGREVDDDRLFGAVLVGGDYYVAGAAGDEPNTIYVFNAEGELLRQFDQPGESRYGMRDLAWDGELLWGAGAALIHGFTLDGEPTVEFEGANNPIYAITWDPRRGLIWCCSITSVITGYDREGNQVATIQNPDLRIYGLAYYEADADDMPLYVLYDAGEPPRQGVFKLNTVSGEGRVAAQLADDNNSRPGGAFITTEYDPYSAVLLSVPNGQSRVDVWQVDSNDDWITLEPADGRLEAGAEVEISFMVQSDGFPEGVYEGEITVNHNARPGQSVIPVTMEVTEGPVHTVRSVDLKLGWNLVSVDLQPDQRDVVVLTQELVENGLLLMMKDQYGHFYIPARDGFNNIEGWSVEQAYWIKVADRARLALEGTTVRADEPIALSAGWQNVAYYPRASLPAPDAFSGLGENLVIAKDGNGSFYSPVWDFNSIGRCRPGLGYQVRVVEDAEFVWNRDNGRGADEEPALPLTLNHFPTTNPTGSDHSLLILADNAEEAAVFIGDRLVGSAAFINGRAGVAIRGDEPTTDAIEGAREGEPFYIMLWSESAGEFRPDFNLLEGDANYRNNGWTVVSAEVSPPQTPFLVTAYPNPFNSVTRVNFNLPTAAFIRLDVFDITGRRVKNLQTGLMTAGMKSTVWKADGFASGVYFIRLTAEATSGGEPASRFLKVMLIR